MDSDRSPLSVSPLVSSGDVTSVWQRATSAHMRKIHTLFLIAALSLGCQDTAPQRRNLVTADGFSELAPGADPVADRGARPVKATFDGRLRLLGVQAPPQVTAGKTAQVTLIFEVLNDVLTDPKIFVHGHAPSAEVNQVGADHKPLGGKHPPTEWRRGDILIDTFDLRVPAAFPGKELLLHIGLYEGNDRWKVSKGEADADNRVLAARLQVEGGAAGPPEMTAYKRTSPIQLDGVLDEATWQKASRQGPFISYDGKRRIRNNTWVRVAWDEENLWVAFECDDTDIHTPYDKRDDPLYESEVVEIFIDADGDKDEYVELQAAPNDVHFDAAFKGGRRKNFDTSYDVNFETKTKLDGTFRDSSDTDKGWVSEWRIPIAELRDVPNPPAPGVAWQVNFFRLDRLRRGEKVIGSEAAAWSSPLSGDFHNLDRFGTLRFSE